MNIYEAAAIPVYVLNLKHEVVWANEASKEHRFDAREVAEALGSNSAKSGVYHHVSGADIYTYSIIVPNDSDYIIAERIKCENIAALLKNPIIRKYVEYVFAKVREAAGNITVACDEIFILMSKLGAYDTHTANCFSAINSGTLNLLNEIIIPEAVACLSEETEGLKTACLSELMAHAAEDAGNMLGGVKLITDIEPLIYTRLDKRIFDVVISDMAYKCVNVEHTTEAMTFSLKRTGADSVSLSITAESGNKKNELYTPCENAVKEILSEYLLETFCNLNEGEFTRSHSDELQACRIDMKVIPEHNLFISMSNCFENVNSRFSPLSLTLAKYGDEKKFSPKEPVLL